MKISIPAFKIITLPRAVRIKFIDQPQGVRTDSLTPAFFVLLDEHGDELDYICFTTANISGRHCFTARRKILFVNGVKKAPGAAGICCDRDIVATLCWAMYPNGHAPSAEEHRRIFIEHQPIPIFDDRTAQQVMELYGNDECRDTTIRKLLGLGNVEYDIPDEIATNRAMLAASEP